MSAAGRLAIGDRVRVVRGDSAYTGCRGTISPPPSQVGPGEDGTPLGYYVAVDGENGRLRPFLTEELERLPVARVRQPRSAEISRRETGEIPGA